MEDAVPEKAVTDGDRLWVLSSAFERKSPGWIIEVDPETQERVGPGMEVVMGFDGDIAVSNGYLWITGDKVLHRIDI